MTTTDTNVNNLIINTMTKAIYDTITPSATELYMVTDDPLNSTDVINALGYTPANSTTVQTALDGKVSKTGDTMTGTLSISESSGAQIKIIHPTEVAGTTPSSEQATGVRFYDKNETLLGYVQNVYASAGNRVTMLNCRNADGTANSNISIGYDSNGNVYTIAPTPASGSSDNNIATTKWVNDNNAWTLSYSQLVNSATTMSASSTLTYSLATYLPSDNYIYEVMYSAKGTTGSTSGNEADICVGSGLIDVTTYRVAAAQTRTSNSVSWAAAGIMLIGSTTAGSTMRAIYIRQSSSSNCTLNYFRVYGYRRLNYAL